MAADPYLYRITYQNGTVKYGHRKVLGPVLGWANGPHVAWRKGLPVKIERLPLPVEWEDITAEVLPSPGEAW